MPHPQEPAEYRISIKAFIVDDEGRLLLVQEDSQEWGLPGGGLDHGETIEEGLRRELQEELGVEVAELGELPISVGPGFIPENSRWKFWLTYRVKLAGEPRPGHAGMKVGWFTRGQIDTLAIDEVEAENLATVRKLLP